MDAKKEADGKTSKRNTHSTTQFLFTESMSKLDLNFIPTIRTGIIPCTKNIPYPEQLSRKGNNDDETEFRTQNVSLLLPAKSSLNRPKKRTLYNCTAKIFCALKCWSGGYRRVTGSLLSHQTDIITLYRRRKIILRTLKIISDPSTV